MIFVDTYAMFDQRIYKILSQRISERRNGHLHVSFDISATTIVKEIIELNQVVILQFLQSPFTEGWSIFDDSTEKTNCNRIDFYRKLDTHTLVL